MGIWDASPLFSLFFSFSGDAGIAAVDDDAPVLHSQRAGLHDAAHVQHRVREGAACGGTQFHAAAVRLDAAELRQAVAGFAARGAEEDQAVAFDVDQRLLRRRQADAPAGRRDRAGVRDHRAGQHHHAARRGDHALVAHFAALRRRGRIAAGTEAEAARHEVGRRQAQRRRDEAADIDPRARAEHHAVRVQQEDAAVGLHVAEDGRRVVAGHAVQQHGGAGRLVEANRLAGADREARPVDDGLLRGLGDDLLRRRRRLDRRLRSSSWRGLSCRWAAVAVRSEHLVRGEVHARLLHDGVVDRDAAAGPGEVGAQRELAWPVPHRTQAPAAQRGGVRDRVVAR